MLSVVQHICWNIFFLYDISLSVLIELQIVWVAYVYSLIVWVCFPSYFKFLQECMYHILHFNKFQYMLIQVNWTDWHIKVHQNKVYSMYILEDLKKDSMSFTFWTHFNSNFFWVHQKIHILPCGIIFHCGLLHKILYVRGIHFNEALRDIKKLDNYLENVMFHS